MSGLAELAERSRWVAEGILAPLDDWKYQCHSASVKLMRSGSFGTCRVARGSANGVAGQHSWLVLGDDCYAARAAIIDPTLWSYDSTVNGVWVGSYRDGRHTPHGKGSIWQWGRPDEAVGPVVELTPRQPFSRAARDFLDLLGPLDFNGWVMLAHAPVEGWPAGEIIDALCDTPDPTTAGTFEAYVPVDIVGMVTDRNPRGLYLPSPTEEAR
jgi:hypothetical protein